MGTVACACQVGDIHFLSAVTLQALGPPVPRIGQKLAFGRDPNTLFVESGGRIMAVNLRDFKLLREFRQPYAEVAEDGIMRPLVLSNDGTCC